MLLYVGSFFRSLSNKFFIHLCDSFDSVYARVLGVISAVIKRRGFFLTQNVYRRLKSAGAGLIPDCNAVVGSICFVSGCFSVLGNGIFLFAKPPKERRGFGKRKVE